MSDEVDGSSLFGVFLLSILSLVLIPWTIYKCCNSETSSKPFELAERKKTRWMRKFREFWTCGNITLLLLWVVAILLLAYVQQTQKEAEIFDPFEILGIEQNAEDPDIKRAYKKLALQYHPDKNPDPKAAEYFAEKITKAHAALTDPISKENWIKHGHPDGPQGSAVGIAIPKWLLEELKDKKRAPMALLLMVASFILLPLAIMGCFLFRSNKFTGPNNIMHETLEYYAYSKYNVKESQSIVRIPETLVVAKEFITLHTPAEHQPACEDIRKLMLRYHPELKEKAAFWKRRASVVKAHLLLLTHLEREQDSVPALLQNDLKYVQERTPALLEEIVKIACIPRRPYGYGWLTPTIGAIQMSQCVVQAVPIASRKQTTRRDHADGYAALLQLPGMNTDLLRQMQKKRIQSLNDLIKMDDKDRVELLNGLRLENTTIQDIDTSIGAIPQLTVTAECVVDGEEEIIEGDVVTCRVHLVITRRSHESGDFTESDLRGQGAQVFSPYFPFKRTEKWYVILAYQPWNAVLTWTHTTLKDAELYGLQYGDPIEKKNNGQTPVEADLTGGQTIEMQFPARHEGTFDFQVICMSDCWIGCDQTIPVKVTVRKQARTRLGSTRPSPMGADSDDDDEDDVTQKRVVKKQEPKEKVPDDGTKYAAEVEEEEEEAEDDDDEEDYDYDSDETGELETGSDEDEQYRQGNGTSTDEEISETDGLQ
ncbi:hypothetical protein BSKO_09470 [Bryopsis sp. KO-2023]|nr:hypothetical protein BSKO_09470 [Bryopsis sp. KO-2023]